MRFHEQMAVPHEGGQVDTAKSARQGDRIIKVMQRK